MSAVDVIVSCYRHDHSLRGCVLTHQVVDVRVVRPLPEAKI